MKILLIVSLIFACGCAFTYDSRDQNKLKMTNAEYAAASADKTILETGRYIGWRIMYPRESK